VRTGRGKFAAIRIIRAEKVKGFDRVGGMEGSAESGVVSRKVVGGKAKVVKEVFGVGVVGGVGVKLRARWRRKGKVEGRRDVKMTARGKVNKTGAVEFALVGMSGDVGRGELEMREKRGIAMRFAFPCVEDAEGFGSGAEMREERGVVNDRPARGVEEDAGGFEKREVLRVEQMMRGI